MVSRPITEMSRIATGRRRISPTQRGPVEPRHDRRRAETAHVAVAEAGGSQSPAEEEKGRVVHGGGPFEWGLPARRGRSDGGTEAVDPGAGRIRKG